MNELAYDKPLKMQWTEINGRAVPLVLPQYWSDEQNDWVVSSEQNRLPVDAQLTGSNAEETRHNIQEIYKTINIIAREKTDKRIYGAYWDKTSDPTLTRTDDAEGLVANVGIDGEYVQNDFDNLPIWGEMGEVTDEYGNTFIRIPKFYIQKKSGKDFYLIRVSKYPHAGFYLPYVFWDFENGREFDYYYHGKYKASLSEDGTRLESKPDRYPLVSTNIVDFRNYALANNDEAVSGYQQNDIHAHDVLRTLFVIEFATLHSQSIMRGFTAGAYSNDHTATMTESNTNRVVVDNSTADAFVVGQTIVVGSERTNSSVMTDRTVVEINEVDANNKEIVFDGDPVDITTGDVVASRGWKTGFSRDVLASSGSIVSNTDGRHPCHYRGIESPWGDIYEFIDGMNINDHQVWVAKNANDYTSNVFAHPYEKLGYANLDENGYPSEMGFDPSRPFAEFPTKLGGSSSTYYADYYYPYTGQRVARVGGFWADDSYAGLFYWGLNYSSSVASISLGGRLLKKPS